MEEHDRVTRLVLERLPTVTNFILRHDKCEFAKTRLSTSELIISLTKDGDGSRENCRSSGMANTEQFSRRGSVFLASTNFYRRFIQGFSDLARALVMSEIKFVLSEPLQD